MARVTVAACFGEEQGRGATCAPPRRDVRYSVGGYQRTTNLSDPTKLATSPLLNLAVVARGVAEQRLEDNRLNRAAVLEAAAGGVVPEPAPAEDAARFSLVQ